MMESFRHGLRTSTSKIMRYFDSPRVAVPGPTCDSAGPSPLRNPKYGHAACPAPGDPILLSLPPTSSRLGSQIIRLGDLKFWFNFVIIDQAVQNDVNRPILLYLIARNHSKCCPSNCRRPVGWAAERPGAGAGDKEKKPHVHFCV
jgi:hypothetical protein